MTIYPAIDLKDGECVRLLHGKMDKATVYNPDPASQARAFEADGYDWLHIVDLDGAFAGASKNVEAVSAILAATNVKTQLGGGIRDMAGVERWLTLGASRVILGTAAVRDPDLVRTAAREFPDCVVVGIDARNDRVKTDGWDGDTGHTPVEIAKRYEDHGVAAIVYTDISRDGALTGVNVEATKTLGMALDIPVIASGGVASEADVTALAAAGDAIEGVIIGRALYDGRIQAQSVQCAAKRPG
ncbi:MAG: 1-(5-phosphoribosyl)-5-[(5-phosphoribosylamino)methylideneamino]imidazole-4-carboxamide isomerase [Pseudomonadota bacterium]